MRRRTIVILAIAFAVVMAGGWPIFRTVGRSNRFLAEATEILSRGGFHPGIVEIELGGGESFRALVEHSCCSGAGFDAVALQTSDGTIYHSRNNYCGEEGFHAAMTDTEHKSLPDLDCFLLANGYTKAGKSKSTMAIPTPPRAD